MIRTRLLAFVALAGCCPSLASAQQYLMLVDSGGTERVILLDPTTGALFNPDFLVDTGSQPWVWDTPKEAIQVGNEIWVTDQLQDSIDRFTLSLTPTYIGRIGGGVTGGLDNVRGMGVVGSRVYVTNAGADNTAPGPSIVVFEFDGSRVGFYAHPTIVSPFDVVNYNGQLLISDSQTHDLTLLNADGTFDRTLVDSANTPMRFPQQLIVANTGAGGTQEIWASGFSPTIGVYRFDPMGMQVARYAVGAPRGLHMLPNGDILYTVSAMVQLFTPPSGTPINIYSVGSGQYINTVNFTIRCVADVDDGTGTGTPDGGVTIDDLLYYLFLFENGSVAADVDDGSGTGTPDGGVTIDDLLYYLLRFENGC